MENVIPIPVVLEQDRDERLKDEIHALLDIMDEMQRLLEAKVQMLEEQDAAQRSEIRRWLSMKRK